MPEKIPASHPRPRHAGCPETLFRHATRPTCPAPRDLKRRSTTNSPSSLPVSDARSCYEETLSAPARSNAPGATRCGFCGSSVDVSGQDPRPPVRRPHGQTDTGLGSEEMLERAARSNRQTGNPSKSCGSSFPHRLGRRNPRASSDTHWGARHRRPYPVVDVRAMAPGLVRGRRFAAVNAGGQHHKPLSVAVSLHGCGTPSPKG